MGAFGGSSLRRTPEKNQLHFLSAFVRVVFPSLNVLFMITVLSIHVCIPWFQM